jgi:3-oxoacyl-[acyl-carrier protein] reductase
VTAQRLAGKFILITGAARGIGFAVAQKCAREGAHVGICDLATDAITNAVEQIHAEGLQASGYHATVTDSGSVKAMVNAALEKMGHIDGLVNNAGITLDATLRKMTDEQWNKVIGVNLTGVFNCTRAVAELMMDQGHGAIVSISSVVGLYGNFGQTNYAATKAGVLGMTLTWAKELGRKGVRANAVCPGFIATPMVAAMPEKVVDMMKNQVPMGRLGQPEEVANVAAFLLSDEASYVNGAIVEVSGGIIM